MDFHCVTVKQSVKCALKCDTDLSQEYCLLYVPFYVMCFISDVLVAEHKLTLNKVPFPSAEVGANSLLQEKIMRSRIVVQVTLLCYAKFIHCSSISIHLSFNFCCYSGIYTKGRANPQSPKGSTCDWKTFSLQNRKKSQPEEIELTVSYWWPEKYFPVRNILLKAFILVSHIKNEYETTSRAVCCDVPVFVQQLCVNLRKQVALSIA